MKSSRMASLMSDPPFELLVRADHRTQWYCTMTAVTQTWKKQNRHAGFSLMELLIVVVIIIVLAAIGMPFAKNMRASAQRTQCINRLRSWSVVLGSYAADHDGKVVWSGWASVGSSDPSPYLPYWSGGTMGSSAGEDESIRSIHKDMRHCPSMPPPKAGANASVNYAMIRPIPQVSNQIDYALASIKNPSRFIFMIEALENTGNPLKSGGDFTTQVKPLAVSGPKLRHNHTVNTLFGDFSVRAMTWPELEKGLSYWTTL
jgi:prepilin-type N-terminal cleavage/methylation domain-containing protein/prepilin-type processing-associated H-X9-DG protein